jgi:hypothetical protein
LNKLKKEAFELINKRENFLLVGDYMIKSRIGLQITDYSGKEVLLREEQDDSSGLFIHCLRTESEVSSTDAPSVRKQLKRVLTDVDWVL